eukprot:952227-Amphidinium_carterae.1
MEYASDEPKNDSEVALTTLKEDWHAFPYLGDAPLEDENFATDARRYYMMLKVTTLSGRSCNKAYDD